MTGFLAEIHRRDRLLSLTGWAHVALAAVMLLGLVVDDRQILGINPWVKPLKFAVSITIYVWTVAWLLGGVRAGAPRGAAVISRGVSLAMFVEIACIAGQSWRGVPSHFNEHTPLNQAIFSVMGAMIALNTLLAAWLLVLYFRRETGLPPSRVWAVRLALALFLVGSGIGGMMIGRGAHAVGVPDGGPGLPFVNWSTEGGDLRPVHSVGLHALQILPLLAWALARIESVSETRRTTAVFAAALVLTLVTATLLVQALNGRPLLVT
jgi:hypothetical protein